MSTPSGLLLALLALLGSPAAAGADEGRTKKVLIIGIDGCRPDALRAARAPHLKALADNGAYSYRAQTGDLTVSGSGWSSMLCGVWREKHGVRGNDFAGQNFAEFPHFFRRVRQARPRAYLASAVHWAPIAEQIVRDADLSTTHRRDAEVVRKAIEVLTRHDPDVLFLHFDEVDGAGHRFGFHPKVPEYLRAIEDADAGVGKVLEALRRRKAYEREDWLILASTDHGGSDKGHGKNIPEHRTVFLIVSGPSAARGEIEPPPGVVDVAATALVHLGIPIEQRWRWDGRPVGLKK
jgi:predicted AlkP superfamily pyrophosphatase or phosphodiesterase